MFVGADPDAADKEGITNLMFASMGRSIDRESMEILARTSKDIDRQSSRGAALHLCASAPSQTLFASILLDHGAQIDMAHALDGSTPLHVAAASDSLSVIELLLTRGADIEKRESRGMTPLMLAATIGSLDAIELLLSRGADLLAKDPEGRAASDHAAAANQSDAAHLLRSLEATALAADLRRVAIPAASIDSGRPRI